VVFMTAGAQRKRLWLFRTCLLAWGGLLLCGCAPETMPERNGIFSSLPEVVSAYQDYLKLERAHTEMLKLKLGTDVVTVTLPFYLFTLGREFERLGRPQDAVKIYLHLQMHFTLLEDDTQNPMGLKTENRLHWILAEKRWFRPSATVLTAALSQALAAKNSQALEALMSRDFGFGEEIGGGERVPLDYHWATKMISERWAGNLKISVNPASGDANTVYLKSEGWGGEHKVWTLVLHRRDFPQGWEWDTINWGD